MAFGSSQPLSPKVIIDLHKNRFPIIRKHEVKSSHINAGPITEAEHRCRSLFLQLWPPGMVKPSSPTDVVVELSAADPKVGDGVTPVNHDPQVLSSMFHPALEQCRLMGPQAVDGSKKVSRLVHGEHKSPTPSSIPLHHEGIAPRRSVFLEILIKFCRVWISPAFRVSDSHFTEQHDLPSLAVTGETGVQAREPGSCMAGELTVAPPGYIVRQQNPGSLLQQAGNRRIGRITVGGQVFLHGYLRLE